MVGVVSSTPTEVSFTFGDFNTLDVNLVQSARNVLLRETSIVAVQLRMKKLCLNCIDLFYN